MRRVKMHLKCTEIFVLLCIFHGTSQVTVEINEMEKYSITCSLKPDMSLTVMWLRATEKNGVEFIVSYKSKNKSWGKEFGQSMDTSDGYKLTIKSFNKETDSGIYNCATYNANRLTFGTSTVLKEKQVIKPPPKTTKIPTMTTNCTTVAPTSCACPKQTGVRGNADPEKRCELMIWAPLAGGCGLLFVVLVTVSLVCNSIRTRRCPHHHKRQPRTAGGKLPAGPNRYV